MTKASLTRYLESSIHVLSSLFNTKHSVKNELHILGSKFMLPCKDSFYTPLDELREGGGYTGIGLSVCRHKVKFFWKATIMS